MLTIEKRRTLSEIESHSLLRRNAQWIAGKKDKHEHVYAKKQITWNKIV